MIRDLSETLEHLLVAKVPGVQIEFDRPSDPYTPSQGQETLNLFLYDIRENVELRSNESVIRRQNNQSTIEPPPLRVACSYVMTAWPSAGADIAIREHRLLTRALGALAQYPTIPAQFLQGTLVGQEPPLPMVTASAEGLQNPTEFWTSVGNRMRASLAISATVAMDVFPARQAASVITVRTDTEMLGEPGTVEQSFRIAGTVTDANAAPVADATVTLLDTGRAANTDVNGEYTLSVVPAGNVTLRVTKGQTTQNFNVAIPAPQGSDYDLQLP